MADETEIIQEDTTNNMYLDTIKELKANSVSKADYEKLVNENRNLLKTIVEGSPVSAETKDEPKASLSELTDSLRSGELNNLDYVKASLEHRARMIEEKGIDPYIGVSHTSAPSDEAIASANQVAEFLQQLVETADGNSQIFTNEYQRLVGDSLPFRR